MPPAIATPLQHGTWERYSDKNPSFQPRRLRHDLGVAAPARDAINVVAAPGVRRKGRPVIARSVEAMDISPELLRHETRSRMKLFVKGTRDLAKFGTQPGGVIPALAPETPDRRQAAIAETNSLTG